MGHTSLQIAEAIETATIIQSIGTTLTVHNMVNEAVVPIPTFNSCLFLKFSVVCWKELDKSLLSLCLAYAMLSSETTFDGLSTWYVQIYRGQKKQKFDKIDGCDELKRLSLSVFFYSNCVVFTNIYA